MIDRAIRTPPPKFVDIDPPRFRNMADGRYSIWVKMLGEEVRTIEQGDGIIQSINCDEFDKVTDVDIEFGNTQLKMDLNTFQLKSF